MGEMPPPPLRSQRLQWLKRLGSLGGRTITALAILAILVGAADKSGLRADLSADHRFTLSSTLVAILREQSEPIELVTLWGEEWSSLAEPCAEGLREMAHENPRSISVRHIDPVLHRVALDDFTKRYHEASAPAIYVLSGSNGSERAFKIPFNQLTRQMLQREIGGALLTLRDRHPPQAILVQGHGELRPDGGDQDGDGRLQRCLELAGFSVKPVELSRGGHIEATSLLILAGPTFALGDSDLRAVEQHIADGGAALIMGDDRMPGDLMAMLRRRGVLWGRLVSKPMPSDWAAFLSTPENGPVAIVASLARNFAGASAFPYHNLVLGDFMINPRHLASAQVANSGQSLLSPYSVMVQVLDPRLLDPETGKALAIGYGKLGIPPFSADPLLQTAKNDAWLKLRAEPFTEPQHLGPSIPIAWALTALPGADSVREDQGARLVLWGSRQAACDGILALENFANQTWLVDLAKWASKREPVSAIPESETAAFRVDITDRGLFWLMAVLIAVVPCSCLGAGILAWWERR
jgi:hypothetical protein